jgi:alpha-1,2-mannosyltransferase
MAPPREPATAAGNAGRYSLVTWAVLSLVIAGLYFSFSISYGGTGIFLQAGDCMLRGEPLSKCSLGYAYPPFFALFMVPLSLLPYWAGNLAWYAVLIASTYGCFWICETLTIKAFGLTQRELFWVRLFTVILSLKFVLAVIGNQAYDGFVFFFLLVGLYGLSENRTFLSAFGLAVAAALKATPLLMLLYPLLLRKWGLFALGAALCVGLSFLPDLLLAPNDPNAGYLRTWLVEVAGGGLLGSRPAEGYEIFFQGSTYFNQSLKASIYRLVDPRNVPWRDLSANAQTILYVVYAVYCLAALAIVLRAQKMEGAHLWAGSVVVISMLMLSPISSKSHFVVLLLPHMVITAYLLKHRELWTTAVPLVCASFLLNVLASRGPMGRALSVKAMTLGSITIATLLLLVVVAVIVVRRRGQPRPAAA